MQLPQWFHKLGSPPWFYQFSNKAVPLFMLLGLILLSVAWTWGLAFSPEDAKQGNSFRIIYLHVPAAVIALAGYYFMALFGFVLLVWRIKLMAQFLEAAALIGAIMTFLALLSGSIWAKPTWGKFWVWDARITSMLILLFLYLGVIALINAYEKNHRQQSGYQAASLLALFGTVNIPIIYKSVDWWNSLHQPATIKFIQESTMHSSMLIPLLLSIIAFYLLYFALLFWRTRVEMLSQESKKSWLKDALK